MPLAGANRQEKPDTAGAARRQPSVQQDAGGGTS